MNARIVRLRVFLIMLLAVGCGGKGGGGTGPPPPTEVPPAVSAGPDAAIPVGSSYALSATFADDAEGPWTYSVAWGDGTTSTGNSAAPGPITARHTYDAEAAYRIRMTVTDKTGASGSDSLNVTATAPVILAAGDIGDCTRTGDDATAALLDTLVGVVVPLGDNAYENGTPAEYANCYDPTWGRQKARTRPVAGNHDFYCLGCTKPFEGYYQYFGAAAGDATKGYYSYTLGSWFVIVLNTGAESPDSIKADSRQERWLRSELASHSQQCVLALFHHPGFSSILNRAYIRPETQPVWNALYQYGADLVLNGHDHAYQRFTTMRPDGTADPTYGIRQITVGTGGGEGLYDFQPVAPATIEVRNNVTLGVLKVTLRAGGYDWRFIPVAGETFTDSGSGTCHGRPS